MWDPRLPHSTGEPAALRRRRRTRQVFYCAFMLARDNGALAAEQRACRDSGLHPSWAPNTHRHDEARSDYVAAPLGELGDALYGYGCAARSADQDRHALAEARAKQRAADDGRWAAAEGGGDSACGLSEAHAAFFARYGYVVVERALGEAMVARIAAEVREHLKGRHGVEPNTGGGESGGGGENGGGESGSGGEHGGGGAPLTMPRLQRAFSPDAGRLLELYWLPAMEAARQAPALLRITQRLCAAARLGANRRRAHNLSRTAPHRHSPPLRYARTWARGDLPGFKLDARTTGQAPPRPSLLYYIDRCSVRLPQGAAAPSARFVPLRRLPRRARRQQASPSRRRPSTRRPPAPPPPPPPRTPPPTATTRTLATACGWSTTSRTGASSTAWCSI